jgi:hypothetical protein
LLAFKFRVYEDLVAIKYNHENNFYKPGGGECFSNKLKMACARDLKALIVFWVNGRTMCWVFNCRTKFQTTCFFNYSRKLNCSIMQIRSRH